MKDKKTLPDSETFEVTLRFRVPMADMLQATAMLFNQAPPQVIIEDHFVKPPLIDFTRIADRDTRLFWLNGQIAGWITLITTMQELDQIEAETTPPEPQAPGRIILLNPR